MATLPLAIDARKMRQGSREATRSLESVRKGSKEAVTGLRGVDRKMDQTGRTAATLKRAFVGLFAGISATVVLQKTISVFGDFEFTMQTVRGVTQATDEQFQRLEETARSLGATTRFSANQSGEALLFLSRAGFDVDEAISALPATLNLAAAGNIDLGRAADFASNILSQFGLQAEETVRVADVLVAVSNRANTDITQLAEAMKFAGPVAGSLGKSVEETAAAIGVLGDSGIQASLAGTNLRGIFAGLLGPTSQALDVFDELNLELEDVDPAVNSLVEIFRRFREANLSASQAVEIFGRRNASAALILTQNVERLEELTEEADNAEDASQNMADTMNDSLNASLLGLTSALQEAMLATGDAGLASAFRDLVTTATGVVRTLAGMGDSVEQNKFLIEALARATIALSAGISAILILRAASWFIGLTAAIQSTTTAVQALRVALLKNPITAIGVAVAALATAFVDFSSDTDRLTSSLERAKEQGRELAATLDRLREATQKTIRAGVVGDEEKEISARAAAIQALEDQIDSLVAKQEELGTDRELVRLNRDFENEDLSSRSSLGRTEQQLVRLLGEDAKFLDDLLNSLGTEVSFLGDSRVAFIQTSEAVEALQSRLEELRKVQAASVTSFRVNEEAARKEARGVELLNDELDKLVSKRGELLRELEVGGFTEEERQRQASLRRIRSAAERANLPESEINLLLEGAREELDQLQELERQIKEVTEAREAETRAMEEQREARREAITDLDEMVDSLQRENALLKIDEDQRDRVSRKLEAQALATVALQGATEEQAETIRVTLTEINRLIDANDALERSQRGVTDAVRDDIEVQSEAARRRREARQSLEEGFGIQERTEETQFRRFALQSGFSEQEASLLLETKRIRDEVNSAIRDADLDADQVAKVREEYSLLIQRFHDAEIALLSFREESEKTRAEQERQQREVERLSRSMAEATTAAFGDIVTGAESVEDAFRNLGSRMIDLALQAAVLAPLSGLFQNFFQPFAGGLLTGPPQEVDFFASGGVVNSPKVFQTGRGTGVAGEAGPEAILPLKRGPDGNLGVQGGQTVNQFITIQTPDADSFRRSRAQVAAALRSPVRRAAGDV